MGSPRQPGRVSRRSLRRARRGVNLCSYITGQSLSSSWPTGTVTSSMTRRYRARLDLPGQLLALGVPEPAGDDFVLRAGEEPALPLLESFALFGSVIVPIVMLVLNARESV